MNYPVHIVAVSGLIENDKGEILMILSPYRGWEIPGGQVEEGESVIDALKREVKEETGIDIEVGKLKAIYSNIGTMVQIDKNSSIGSIVSLGFTGKAISGEVTISEESIEVSWVRKEKVLDLIDKDFMKDRVKAMLDSKEDIIYGAFTHEPYILHQVKYI